MTREKMIKTKWIPYMKILYKTQNMENAILCMLCAINFESEVVQLIPINSEIYEQEEFFMSINYIELPRPKPMKL